MTKIEQLLETYSRLRNGNIEYLKALNLLVEYKVTNGKLQKQVEIYLNQDKMKLRFYIYIGLLSLTSISTSFFLLALNIPSMIVSTISLLIVAYALFQLVYLYQYLKKSNIYIEVYDYVNAYKPGTLEEIYYDYKKNKK